MICDCEKLLQRISESPLTDESLAEKMGVSRKNLASKLRDPAGASLTVEDIFKLCDLLDIDDPRAYFFTDGVAKTQL